MSNEDIHPLDRLYQDVKQFHTTFGHPVGTTPRRQPADRAKNRAKWIRSEMDELEEAEDVVEQADAYLDSIYFGIGGLVDLGVPPGALWDLVHAANMAKVQPDGSVKRYPDGKIMKPDGWEAPDDKIRAHIEKLVRDRQASFL